MPRLPILQPEDMTPAQRAVHDSIATGPRGGVRGPWPYGCIVRNLPTGPSRLADIAGMTAALHRACLNSPS